MHTWKQLLKREQEGNLIRIALLGVGQMGAGLICQCERIPGMRVVAASSRRPKSCFEAWQSAGISNKELAFHNDPYQADIWIAQGGRAILPSMHELCTLKNIDIVVEATGSPASGVELAYTAIQAKKHVLQMNVEADATVGYMLRKYAEEQGVIYTLSGGDEPGATMQLADFAQSLAFKIVSVGKGKNNVVNRYATAQDTAVQKKAQRFAMSAQMLTSFVDGCKTMVEMASLGNALGFGVDVAGMHGIQATAAELAQKFIPKRAGGLLGKTAVVDYALGVAPGVFVIIEVEHPKVLLDLQYLALGDGPYYALYRPYHLVSLETPLTVFAVVERHETILACEKIPCLEATARLKRDCTAGEELSAMGGNDYYGMLDNITEAREHNLLPLGLAPTAKLVRKVKKDQALTWSDVELNEDSLIVKLAKEQFRITANQGGNDAAKIAQCDDHAGAENGRSESALASYGN